MLDTGDTTFTLWFKQMLLFQESTKFDRTSTVDVEGQHQLGRHLLPRFKCPVTDTKQGNVGFPIVPSYPSKTSDADIKGLDKGKISASVDLQLRSRTQDSGYPRGILVTLHGYCSTCRYFSVLLYCTKNCRTKEGCSI